MPPIRPLETLHNALSLRQLDCFLDMMTSAPLFRTPASSPPKFPSPGGSTHCGTIVTNLSIGGINREYHSSDIEAVRYRKNFNTLPVLVIIFQIFSFRFVSFIINEYVSRFLLCYLLFNGNVCLDLSIMIIELYVSNY